MDRLPPTGRLWPRCVEPLSILGAVPGAQHQMANGVQGHLALHQSWYTGRVPVRVGVAAVLVTALVAGGCASRSRQGENTPPSPVDSISDRALDEPNVGSPASGSAPEMTVQVHAFDLRHFIDYLASVPLLPPDFLDRLANEFESVMATRGYDANVLRDELDLEGHQAASLRISGGEVEISGFVFSMDANGVERLVTAMGATAGIRRAGPSRWEGGGGKAGLAPFWIESTEAGAVGGLLGDDELAPRTLLKAQPSIPLIDALAPEFPGQRLAKELGLREHAGEVEGWAFGVVAETTAVELALLDEQTGGLQLDATLVLPTRNVSPLSWLGAPISGNSDTLAALPQGPAISMVISLGDTTEMDAWLDAQLATLRAEVGPDDPAQGPSFDVLTEFAKRVEGEVALAAYPDGDELVLGLAVPDPYGLLAAQSEVLLRAFHEVLQQVQLEVLPAEGTIRPRGGAIRRARLFGAGAQVLEFEQLVPADPAPGSQPSDGEPALEWRKLQVIVVPTGGRLLLFARNGGNRPLVPWVRARAPGPPGALALANRGGCQVCVNVEVWPFLETGILGREPPEGTRSVADIQGTLRGGVRVEPERVVGTVEATRPLLVPTKTNADRIWARMTGQVPR